MKEITLHNLNEFSLQEIFNYVKHHLLTQNKKALFTWSTGCVSCKYRTEYNLKCAVGCLIPKDMYKSEIEGSTVFKVVNFYNAKVNKERVALLRKLQIIHDHVSVEKWTDALHGLSKELSTEE